MCKLSNVRSKNIKQLLEFPVLTVSLNFTFVFRIWRMLNKTQYFCTFFFVKLKLKYRTVFEIVYTVDHSQHNHYSSFYTVFQLIWMNECARCTNLRDQKYSVIIQLALKLTSWPECLHATVQRYILDITLV